MQGEEKQVPSLKQTDDGSNFYFELNLLGDNKNGDWRATKQLQEQQTEKYYNDNTQTKQSLK